jgi:hypothetical protein
MLYVILSGNAANQRIPRSYRLGLQRDISTALEMTDYLRVATLRFASL